MGRARCREESRSRWPTSMARVVGVEHEGTVTRTQAHRVRVKNGRGGWVCTDRRAARPRSRTSRHHPHAAQDPTEQSFRSFAAPFGWVGGSVGGQLEYSLVCPVRSWVLCTCDFQRSRGDRMRAGSTYWICERLGRGLTESSWRHEDRHVRGLLGPRFGNASGTAFETSRSHSYFELRRLTSRHLTAEEARGDNLQQPR